MCKCQPAACFLRAGRAKKRVQGALRRVPKIDVMKAQPSAVRSCGASFLIGMLLGLLPAAAARAQENTALGIELNKLESTEEGCRAVFVFYNNTEHELNRFRIDLILFDPQGIYDKQLLVDMAPLYPHKKTVASFLLAEKPCAEVGSILVNDLPWCEDGAGSELDCVGMLDVWSLADVPLQK
jgi:hypothetical protein